MMLAPASLEPQVEIAERAGSGDLSDMREPVEAGRLRLERGQHPGHLAGLMLDPSRLVTLRRPPAAFIDSQNACIHKAVGERLLAQRQEARRRLGRNDPAAAGAMIE